MGDAAEQAFERDCDMTGRGFVRFGLNRPPLRVASLPARIRYAPDYLTGTGFVECQGFGRKQKVMLKVEKYGSLCWWNDLWPVTLFLWDSHRRRSCELPLRDVGVMIDEQYATLDYFPEGKAYFSLAANDVWEAAAA